MANNKYVVDLSHWDPADNYSQVKAAGVYGVIYKATEGPSYTDSTYPSQQKAAKAAGLKWGAYHFADSSNVDAQVQNFLNFASPDPEELFCLDWEDNGGDKMSAANVKKWVNAVEAALKRPGECVIYSGNTAKEALGNTKDPWFGARRLWLAQYSSTPTVQASWTTYWLWQYTEKGSCPGIPSSEIDLNNYAGTPEQLVLEWASGSVEPAEPAEPAEPTEPANPITPTEQVVSILINAPTGIKVLVNGKEV